ncbi:MAG: EpsD family peptidyl-prolyl cis-trans isomerase [Acidiferrobacteraceae bacterium]
MKTRVILTALLALAVASCGRHGSEHKNGQVAAEVNGHQITVLQVNTMLAHVGKVSAAQSQQVADSVLKNLVNQELLVQQAIKKKLDRNPQVLQAILASRKQILAQAYLAQRFSTIAPPTDGAIMRFYEKHPDLFAHRQIYQVQTIVVQGGESKAAAIQNALSRSKTPKAFLAWLKSQNLPFHAAIAVRSAEQIPLAMLPQMNRMKDGQAIIGRSGANLTVLIMLAKQEQPLTLAQAKGLIAHYLVNRDRQKIVKRTLRNLQATAKIKYFGAFAGAGKGPSATNPTSTKAPKASGDQGASIAHALQ